MSPRPRPAPSWASPCTGWSGSRGGTVSDGCAVDDLVVGVLGGTGPQGRGLAVRPAAAGQRVLLGSRDGEKAAEVAGQVAERAAGAGGPEASVTGGGNADVAAAAD